MALTTIPRSYQSWVAISATPNDFNLDAGNYALTVGVLTAGSVQLQRLLPDGATYVNISAAITVVGQTMFTGLPAGQYKLVVTTGPFTGMIEKVDVGRASGR